MRNFIERHRLIKLVFTFVVFMPLLFIASCYNNTINDLYMKANECYHNAQHDEAIKIYKKVLKLQPGHIGANINIGNIYFFYKKDYEKAEDIWKKTLKLYPKEDTLYLNLSQLYLEKGNLEKGLDEYRNYIMLTKDAKPTIYIDAIWRIIKKKNYTKKQAYELYREIIAINPKDYLVLNEIAEYLKNNAKYKEALDTYKTIIDIGSDEQVVYLGMGTCYYNLGELNLALEYFKKAKEAGQFVPDVFFEKLEKEMNKGTLDNNGVRSQRDTSQ